jgi:hypothetical protein
MAIPLIQAPSLTGTPLRQTTPSAATLGAPAAALGDVARGIASVGGAFAKHADQIQGFENARTESEARQKIAAEYADFQNRMATEQDPAKFLPELQKVQLRTQSIVDDDTLPPVTRERLGLWHSDLTHQSTLRTAADASKLTLRRAAISLQNEMDSAVEYGDPNAFKSVLDRSQEAGILLPEEAAAKQTQFDQAHTAKQLAAQIDADPETSLEMLQSDDILTRYPNLTPTNRDQLLKYATQKTNHQKAETWDQITLASLDGAVLSREDIMGMAKEGDITPSQAGSYLNAYHGPTPPEYDPFVFAIAQSDVLAYDPAKDPTGVIRAHIASNLATLPLPKEYITELSTQFKARINPTEEDAPKHKLAKDYLTRIETEWKSQAFGDWFDIVDDPNDSRISRKVIRQGDFDKAISYRTRVTDHFLQWLGTQPPDIDPIEVGKKYDELKARALDETQPLDLTPSTYSPDLFDDVDDLYGEPPAPEVLPETSYIPNAHKREATIPYVKGGPAANVRYNNPGAAWPRPEDVKYGLIGYGKLNDGEGNKIGRFPTPVHGAAANFDLFASKYSGMTMSAAMTKWRGRPSPTPKGYDPNARIDQNFLNDPKRAIDFFKKMALNESPTFNSMSDDDWMKAWQMWRTVSGSKPTYTGDLNQRKTSFFKTQRPRTPEEAEQGLAALYQDYYAEQAHTETA